MAHAAVTFVAQKLGDLLIQEGIYLSGVREQVDWLVRELRTIQCFLIDAESKSKADEQVKNWVRDVRDVAHQSGDLIDIFILKVQRWRKAKGMAASVKRYAHILNELVACHTVRVEIEEIKTKITAISNRRISYGIASLGETGGHDHAEESLHAQRRVLPTLDATNIVGFEKDKKIVMKRLLDQEIKRRCVISIVGMGGLGKTTLANKIFNSSEVRESFATRCWVSVPKDCNVTELLKDITVRIMGGKREKLGSLTEEDLMEKLHEFLKLHKYLVFLDDVWTVESWDRIKMVFPDVGNGSRVMITTRFRNVATMADPSTHFHELRFLNPEESWELFLKRVFPNLDMETCCPKELVDLGRQLVDQCGGLPLALVVLGGYLSINRKTPEIWLNVVDSMRWQLTDKGDQCLRILGLSYSDLTYHLKLCFLYLASFPEDYVISATKLIRLWVAEGFIPQRQRETIEETARGCLEELAQRCIIQVVERNHYNGRIKKIRVHDLLHDLSMSKARENGFFDVYNRVDQTTSNGARRLVLQQNVDKYISLNPSTPVLRTLLGFHLEENYTSSIFDGRKFYDFFKGLKLLRVLDLKGASSLKRLPKEIKNMIHLRYLGLSYTKLEDLPSSIRSFPNLQTVDVYNTNIRRLPTAFWKIPTLRHVLVDREVLAPTAIGSNNLQTLRNVKAGAWIERDLAKMTTLRKLSIYDASVSHMKALSYSLEKLHHLSSFRLVADSNGSLAVEVILALRNNLHLHSLFLYGTLSRQLPDCHEFPPYLAWLGLGHSGLEHNPMAALEKLPNLKFLHLRCQAFAGKEMVCSAGGFPRLEFLNLQSLNKLENWRVEDGAMPSLTHLTISWCDNLRELPEGLRMVTTLQNLEIWGMPDKFLNRVREGGGDRHKIQHVPTIVVDGM